MERRICIRLRLTRIGEEPKIWARQMSCLALEMVPPNHPSDRSPRLGEVSPDYTNCSAPLRSYFPPMRIAR